MLLTVFALAANTAAVAQHYVGLRAGTDGSYGRFYPKPSETGTVWGLYHGGVSWKYYTQERFVGGVEVDLLFMQQGYRNYTLSEVPLGSDEPAYRISYYQRRINSVMIPAYWQSHVFMFKRRLRIFLNLGITFSYNISSREETYSYETQETTAGDYAMKLTRDNPFSYGLSGGFGLGWNLRRLEIFAEGRYYFGYGDILRNRNKYELNPLRSPLDNIQISAGVYWKLGDTDGESAARRAQRAAAREVAKKQLSPKQSRNAEKKLMSEIDQKIGLWEAEEQQSLEQEERDTRAAMAAQNRLISRNVESFIRSVGQVSPIRLADIPVFEPQATASTR